MHTVTVGRPAHRYSTVRAARKVNGMLKFAGESAKIRHLRLLGYRHIYSFSLPSGWTCPYALDCLSKAVVVNGKAHIQDGKSTLFRCFEATDEARYSTVRAAREENFTTLRALKTTDAMATSLLEALPTKADVVRIHIGGDFYNEAYFKAWVQVALARPRVHFYAYTKSIAYWLNSRDSIPDNLVLQASLGGSQDTIALMNRLKTARVVYHPNEADRLGIEIDHDESHAVKGSASFALLIHGTQPKGSNASRAIKRLKREQVSFSYTGRLVT